METPKMMGDMYSVQQGVNEHPRTFLRRYLKLVRQINNVVKTVATNLFRESLQNGSLLSEQLYLNPPRDLANIQLRSEEVFKILEIREEEARRTALITKLAEGNPPLKDKRDKRRPEQPLLKRGEKEEQNVYEKMAKKKYPHIETIVPMNHIYNESKDKPIWRNPFKINSLIERRDHNKYCPFHKDVSHTLPECRSLYNQVNHILRTDGLPQYVKNTHNVAQ
ncbi:uncharacterized protein LOC133792125 [Humulus lupulus]|uniref:uncharacterized protein LOC133792125 n=1 Tax=Humulus lupulus TaxID=3486 RepID=UPI002B40510E|nr:uncharacterized protein LOC133792125 [Humulus lupulus]